MDCSASPSDRHPISVTEGADPAAVKNSLALPLMLVLRPDNIDECSGSERG